MTTKRRVVVCATTYTHYEFIVDSSEISEDSDESASDYIMGKIGSGCLEWPEPHYTDSAGTEVLEVEIVHEGAVIGGDAP